MLHIHSCLFSRPPTQAPTTLGAVRRVGWASGGLCRSHQTRHDAVYLSSYFSWYSTYMFLSRPLCQQYALSWSCHLLIHQKSLLFSLVGAFDLLVLGS